MSDPESSGAPAPAPAESPALTPPPAETSSAVSSPATTPSSPSGPSASAPGAFGTSRGSGLARGKRPATAPAAAGPATPTGYKPSALAVISTKSEYKNPFTGETSVGAPPAAEPAPVAVAAPSVDPGATAPLPPAAPGVPAPAESAPPASPAQATSERAEIRILPPEEAKRAEVRWEAPRSDSAGGGQSQRRDDRSGHPSSREHREPRAFEPREPREPRSFEPREPRRDDHRFEPRSRQPYPEPAARGEPEKKRRGFLGWFKGLFRRKKPAEGAAPEGERERGEHRGRGDPDYRRHRGGRDRGGHGGYREDPRGPRHEGQPRGEGDGYRGEPRGEGEPGGHRRRRRRGGRGRYRGEGGPRSEGQQGGGAI